MLICIPQAGISIPSEGIVSIEIKLDPSDPFQTTESQAIVVRYDNSMEIELGKYGYYEIAFQELQDITEFINKEIHDSK